MLNLDSQWPQLPEDIDFTLAQQIPNPVSLELKGARLYRQIRRGLRLSDNEDETDRSYEASHAFHCCFTALIRHGVPVFGAAVDRMAFKQLQEKGQFADLNPYSIAFGECLRQIDNYAHTMLPREQILWIADRAGHYEASMKDVLRAMRETQKALGGMPPPGFSEPRVSHISDTIYFGNSHESRMLQLADLCATTLAFHLRQEAYAERHYEQMRPQLVNEVLPLFRGM